MVTYSFPGEAPDAGEPVRSLAAPPLRAMIVSDHEAWLQALGSVLEPRGYHVLRAVAGAEVPESLDLLMVFGAQRGSPSALLWQQLRDGGQIDAATPVILITVGPCRREERLHALRAGAWECFGSPVDTDLLLLKLDTYARARLQAGRALRTNPFPRSSASAASPR